MKRITLMLLTAIYAAAFPAGLITALIAGPQSCMFWTVRMLVLLVVGFGAWIGKCYLEWRWDCGNL